MKVSHLAKDLANSVVAETACNMETDFLLSRFIYLATSTPTEAQRATRKSLAAVEALGNDNDRTFEALDVNNDGFLDREEVLAAAPKFNMSRDQASELFDRLDLDGDGVLTHHEFSTAARLGHSLRKLAGLPQMYIPSHVDQGVRGRSLRLEKAIVTLQEASASPRSSRLPTIDDPDEGADVGADGEGADGSAAAAAKTADVSRFGPEAATIISEQRESLERCVWPFLLSTTTHHTPHTTHHTPHTIPYPRSKQN